MENYIKQIPPSTSLSDLVDLSDNDVSKEIDQSVNQNHINTWNKARRISSGLSALGNVVSYIPHPAAKFIGYGLQIPDTFWDITDAQEAFKKKKNRASTASSLVFDSAGFVPGIYTSIASIADDLSDATTGNNLYDNTGYLYNDIRHYLFRTPEKVYNLPQVTITSNKKANGGPIKKSYKDFSTRLSKAWGNDDLSEHNYDYQKYYNDDPDRAYRQLISIEKGGQGHFDDEGKSGTYKTPNHATYPDLGSNSWLNNGRIFNISARQANQGLDNIRDEINTDRILDYLGSDLKYNNGATKVMYNGAYQLPSVTVTPNGNYTELIPNELGTGWMYRDRAGRFDDVDYSYLDEYLDNKKAFGGKLHKDWSDLSIFDRNEFIKTAVQNGITSLMDIKDKYNEFQQNLIYNSD